MTMQTARGSILIVVLFVMLILSLVGVSFAYRAGLESRTAKRRAIYVQLRAQAQSAAAIALARLSANRNEFDHPAEPWAVHAPLGSEGWLSAWQEVDGQPPAFVADYQVIDEEGKLHVAAASTEALEVLGMSAEQVASLMDWQDTDDVVGSEGAENDYYQRRNPFTRCKNSPLETLSELLLIRGFTFEDYEAEDTNHNGRLDPGEDDGPLRAPLDDADVDLRLGCVDLLTCVGDGRINLNTTPAAVLATLPLSDGAVDQIVGYRSFDEFSSGQLEDHAFRGNDDINQLQGLSPADRDVLRWRSKFKSGHFRVFVEARHLQTNLSYKLESLVRTDGRAPEILECHVSR